MLVPVSEIVKIPSQREKLLKAIEDPPQSFVDRQPTMAYQDALVILQNGDKGEWEESTFLPFFACERQSITQLHAILRGKFKCYE